MAGQAFPRPRKLFMRRLSRTIAAAAVVGMVLAGCQQAPAPPPSAPPSAGFSQVGLASWYGPHFLKRTTAGGERFDGEKLTAAHRTLPLNTMVRVTNLENGRSIVVRINDRGPFSTQRIIDLSPRAASDLDMRDDGVVRVRIEVIAPRTASGPSS